MPISNLSHKIELKEMQIEFNKLNLYQRNWHKGKIELNIYFVKFINQIEEITKEIFKSI